MSEQGSCANALVSVSREAAALKSHHFMLLQAESEPEHT